MSPDNPYATVVLPFVLVCLFNVVRVFWVYSRRVPCGVADRLGAMLAGLSLVYTIGKAFLVGLVSSSRSFGRTPKSASKFSALSATREELVFLVLLLAAIALTLNQDRWTGFDRVVWVLALALQSLPFAASVALGAVSSVCQRRFAG